MKNLKFLSVVTLVVLLFFSSCDVKSEKGKEILDEAAQNMIDQADALSNSEFTDALMGFFFIDYPFVDTKKDLSINDFSKIKFFGTAIKNSIINKYPEIFNKKIGDTTLSISSYYGTYTWDDTIWNYSSEPADKVILIFPSPTSITNDLRFEWSAYEEVKTTDGYYYPTVIYAELFKDNKKIGLIDYTATWDLDFEYPLTLDAKLQLDPMKFNVNYSFENSIATLDAHVSKGLRTLDDIEAEVTFKNDSMNEVTYVTGIFKTYDMTSSVNTGVLMKVKFDVNVEAIGEEATCAQINENSTIELYTSSNRMFATVECSDSDDCDMIFVFTDGTTASVCDYEERIGDAFYNMMMTSGLYFK